MIQSMARFAYFAAAIIGAVTLLALLFFYPYDDLQQSIGKFAGTTGLVAGSLCFGATIWRKPVVPIATLAIILGAAAVAWAGEFIPLPAPPDVIGDKLDSLAMLAAGLCTGGAIGLLFASLFRTGLKQVVHALFGLIHVGVAAGAGAILMNVGPTVLNEWL